MLKKASLITSLLFILISSNVFAYSSLKSSSPTFSESVLQEHNPIQLILGSSQTAAASHSSASLLKREELPLSAYIIPGVVGIVTVIGLGSYWLFFRKKHL